VISDDQLRLLFARHCECRPLDLTRGEGDHAAIHDCDTGVLHDVQVALGIVLSTIGADKARARCAELLARKPLKLCAHCARSSEEHPVPCFGCQTCQFACDHYICTKYVSQEQGHR
jgi:hypothetical protein